MARLLLFSLLVIFCQSTLYATHIVGGELTYRCLGNDQYEIKLSVYRDCYNGVPWFDDPASVGIFNASFTLIEERQLAWNGQQDTLDIYLNNPCLVQPPDVCVHRTTYVDTVSLPFISGGYRLVYQRCCRNKLIRNIPLPESVGITIIAEIDERALLECNQGAAYRFWPPLAICVHEPINFDHSAIDLDGDSLAYRLCTPLSGATEDFPQPQPPNPGPYIEVPWQDPPYNLSNLLGGDPLTINPTTGFITGVPNTIGNFVVGVCVDEFRDGQVISTTRRDFQYNVADCGQSEAAFFVPEPNCDDFSLNLDNLSLTNPLSTFDWYFDWGGDLSLQGTGYEPQFTFPDTGHYTVALILNQSYVCRDTFFQDVYITRTVAAAGLDLDFPDCDSTGVTVQFTDQSTDPVYGINAYNWYVTGPDGFTFQSNEPNPGFTSNVPGQYFAQLTVTSGNGCTSEITQSFTVPLPSTEGLGEQLLICPGDTVGLLPGADPAFRYTWTPANLLSDPMAPNPLVGPTESTVYNVTITDPDLLCQRSGEVEVVVLAPGTLTATATPPTIVAGQSSQLLASFPGALGFTWSPAGSLSDPNIANPLASPTDSTTYTVSITTSSECVPTARVTVTVIPPICGEPLVFFPTGFSPNGDGENELLKMEGSFATEVYWVIYNRWGQRVFEANSLSDAWDGTFRGQPQPAETYGYYYRIRCADGQVSEKQGNVTLLR